MLFLSLYLPRRVMRDVHRGIAARACQRRHRYTGKWLTPSDPLILAGAASDDMVPQFICGCDLSVSRVSKVEKIWSPSLSVNTQAPSMYFLSPDATLSAAHRADILSSILPLHVLGGPDRLKVGGRSKAGNVDAHQRPKMKCVT